MPEHIRLGLVPCRWFDRESDAGFTLTELLVVIAILGILGAVVVFAVGGINNTSQNSACAADRSALQNAQEAYYPQNHAYAANGAALVTAKFLRSDSKWHQTDNTGAVTAIPKDARRASPGRTRPRRQRPPRSRA